jgi:hypothetical protein
MNDKYSTKTASSGGSLKLNKTAKSGEFEKFQHLAQGLVRVPKNEIDAKRAEEKKAKA